MIETRKERFQGYCPTQDKWETAEQNYLNITNLGSTHEEYFPGLIACPHISFRNGKCDLINNCPVISGEWTDENPNVFVALQFITPDKRPNRLVEDVIKPVCLEFGLSAFIVSDIEHNDGIYDVILKSIAKSRLVIADLTYSNNGAYYEAGYAKGQGKEVIHTCANEWFTTAGVHFDVKGLNLIIYNSHIDFAEKLRKRIREGKSVIGK